VRDSTTKLALRYALPLVGAALAFWLRLALHPSFLDRGPFLLPFFVVLATAWFAGLGPGLLATAASFLLATGYPALGWVDIEPTGVVPALLRFGVGTVVVCFLVDRVQRGERRLRSEDDRRQSQTAELAAIVESSDDAIVGKTLDGIVTSWNAGAERLSGYTAAEMIGRSIAVIVPPERPDELPSILARLARGERITHYDTVRVRKDGSRVEVSVTISPIRGPSGQVIGAADIMRDVTERRRTEAMLRFLAEASESLSSLVDYRATLQKVAQLAVPGFADWCGVDMVGENGAIEGLAVAHVDPSKVELAKVLQQRYPPDPNAPYGVPKVLRTGVSERVAKIEEAVIAKMLPDDERRRIVAELGPRSYMCVPLRLKERTLGVMSFVAAESGRSYDEADLKVAEDLARRAAIAIDNARLYQELRDSDRRKDEFLAVLSHELRNPLAPIRSGIDMLAMGEARQSPELIELMRQQVEHLVRLVDDLLDLSRITRDRVELKRREVELGPLLERAVAAIRGTLEQRDQTVTIVQPRAPVWLDADPVRLLQVLENLLQNASKFSDAGSPIELRAERSGDQVSVRVRDQGIGMDAALLPHLFEPFTQASYSIHRAQGGLGVGLALVRGLVERHGGTVSARSAGPGLGSEFEVRLPVRPVSAPRETPGEETKPAGEPQSDGDGAGARRVLVVDDNVAAAQMLSMLVSRLGRHQVDTAHDGPSAIEKVRASHPEVVLLDIGLPAMDGYEVGRAIREDPRFDDVLIVALTGYGQEEDRRRSREAGIDEHLVKPAAIEDIERMLAHPKLRQSALEQ
jgi:PAS domain S-box-containing protein